MKPLELLDLFAPFLITSVSLYLEYKSQMDGSFFRVFQAMLNFVTLLHRSALSKSFRAKSRTPLNMDGTLKGVFPKSEINGTILMEIISLIYL